MLGNQFFWTIADLKQVFINREILAINSHGTFGLHVQDGTGKLRFSTAVLFCFETFFVARLIFALQRSRLMSRQLLAFSAALVHYVSIFRTYSSINNTTSCLQFAQIVFRRTVSQTLMFFAAHDETKVRVLRKRQAFAFRCRRDYAD